MKLLFFISLSTVLIVSGCATKQTVTSNTIETTIPSDSPLSKIRNGMGLSQVRAILGGPTDQQINTTGKAYIPFYFGSDAVRTILYYKGLGQVQFGSGRGKGPTVNKIVYDPNEDGYKGDFKVEENATVTSPHSSKIPNKDIEKRTSFALGLDHSQFAITNREDNGIRTDYSVNTKNGEIYRCYLTGLISSNNQIVSDAVCSKRKNNEPLKLAQKRLNEIGYRVGVADGKMGNKTRNAIKSFQQKNDLPVTGFLDTSTQLKLGI